ncbi:MAG TPA: DUF2950 domain-containing protein [Opitutales bacterium]|nr:DUF2950 domain-containing protein [Opitutales bacterium]
MCLTLVIAGCASVPEASSPSAAASTESAAPSPLPAKIFDSPDDAVEALLGATQSGDQAALHDMFGPALDQLLSGDSTQDAVEFSNFAKKLALMCNPVPESDDKVILYIGDQNWPFPIPLVRVDGKWHFDTAAGKEEVLNRRIGEDEITAMSVCLAYVAAQHDYFSLDRDGDGVLSYAQRLNSNPGKHDGLYWEPVEGEDLSPLGPLIANAHEEGYDTDKPIGRTEPFHGYYFKILKEQGADAPGGKYNYVINGYMVAGFALVAYPAHWGESGIMTFIINQNGKIYQSDLGANSATTASAMTVFNPGKNWTALAPDGLALP